VLPCPSLAITKPIDMRVTLSRRRSLTERLWPSTLITLPLEEEAFTVPPTRFPRL
ncbi:hypothetical protein BGX30_008031, partial [Mortierella sp. GBA39]